MKTLLMGLFVLGSLSTYANCVTPNFDVTLGKDSKLTQAVEAYEKDEDIRTQIDSLSVVSICTNEDTGIQKVDVTYSYDIGEDITVYCEGVIKIKESRAILMIDSICEAK